jgi:hypothetical protein
MKRSVVVALTAGAALALSAIGASTASARCYRVDNPGDGFYRNIRGAECLELLSPANGEWEEAEPVRRIRPGLWCAKVTVHFKTGRYDTSECNEKLNVEPKGEYELILVPECEGAGGSPGVRRPNAGGGAATEHIGRRAVRTGTVAAGAVNSALFIEELLSAAHSPARSFTALLL